MRVKLKKLVIQIDITAKSCCKNLDNVSIPNLEDVSGLIEIGYNMISSPISNSDISRNDKQINNKRKVVEKTQKIKSEKHFF